MAHPLIAVVILAAGRSRRMGRPKLLLPWRGTTVVARLIDRWRSAGVGQLAVVHGSEPVELLQELDRIGLPGAARILNARPEAGMFHSIQCAARWSGWAPQVRQWLVTLGDQPLVQDSTIEALLELGLQKPEFICQPLRNGRPRHPVLLPRDLFMSLADSTAADLKTFLSAFESRCAGFEADDPGLDLDLDTPQDYERLKRLIG